jgi:carbon-monoxide dehydrogenase large subunit
MPRREDDALLTGKGRFVSDICINDPLYVTFVRAMEASGTILDIDIEAARQMPGVVGVFTSADLPAIANLPLNKVLENMREVQFPVLAGKQVLALGQPVAAIVSQTAIAGIDAAEAVYVDIDTDNPITAIDTRSDPAFFQHWKAGSPDQAFSNAAHIIDVKISHPRLAPASLEPRGIAIEYDNHTAGITIWLSTQTPHRSRDHLAMMLDIDKKHIRLIAPDVGGAFGMKASIYPEDVFCLWAALKLKRSLRWSASRQDDLISATHGRGACSNASLAVADDGTFLGLRAQIDCPLGYWLPNSAAIPAWNAARILPGPYALTTVDISTRAFLTNTAPVGIYRGAGRPEAAMLMERLVEKAARVLDIDALELRRKNLVPSSDMPWTGPTGTVLDSGDYNKAVKKLSELAKEKNLASQLLDRRKNGELVGMGFAFYVEPSGTGWESARVKVKADGRILAATGSSTQGQGRKTAYAQIVADVFGTTPDNITIEIGDTKNCPTGIGALASRSTPIGASAIFKAATKAKAEHDRTAQPASAECVYTVDAEAWGYGCYLAVVAIDVQTGNLVVENLICVDDTGNMINPALVRGQITGGIAQGLGEAILEEIIYDNDGQLLTGSLSDYALPRADHMPQITIATMTTPTPANLLGAKGIGEAGTIGAPAAIVNATLDGLAHLGIENIDMPLTSQRIWQAINRAKNEGSDEIQ